MTGIGAAADVVAHVVIGIGTVTGGETTRRVVVRPVDLSPASVVALAEAVVDLPRRRLHEAWIIGKDGLSCIIGGEGQKGCLFHAGRVQ
jgi:hypothetical protein